MVECTLSGACCRKLRKDLYRDLHGSMRLRPDCRSQQKVQISHPPGSNYLWPRSREAGRNLFRSVFRLFYHSSRSYQGKFRCQVIYRTFIQMRGRHKMRPTGECKLSHSGSMLGMGPAQITLVGLIYDISVRRPVVRAMVHLRKDGTNKSSYGRNSLRLERSIVPVAFSEPTVNMYHMLVEAEGGDRWCG